MEPKFSFSHFITFLSRDSLLCPNMKLDLIQSLRCYVEKEGRIHEDRLNFCFACEGLKQQKDSTVISKMITAIYQFLRRSTIKITNGLDLIIRKSIKSGSSDINVFNCIQEIIGNVFCATTLRKFFNTYSYLSNLNNFTDFFSLSISNSLKDLSLNATTSSLIVFHIQSKRHQFLEKTLQSYMEVKKIKQAMTIHHIRNRHMEWEIAWKKNFDQIS